jgi:hypothetical protein
MARFRSGVGWTNFDFIDDNDNRFETSPLTLPVGIGVNWPVRSWLSAQVD